jgi:hypothetical protein
MNITLLSILFVSLSYSQNYSLDFNGEGHYVEVENASAVITNSAQMTISGWIHPRNTDVGWPDLDAFFGIRNENNADFYILQLGGYKLEGRLRTDSGVFTIVTDPNAISPDTWHHVALVYDGSTIMLYIDGIPTNSAEANGQIPDPSVSFYIGSLMYSVWMFDLNGLMDEVRIWDRALYAEEIQEYMNFDVTGYENLVGYWKFNEGSGTIAYDSSEEGNDGMIYGATWSTNVPAPSSNTITVNYNEDWNLVGLPVEVENSDYTLLFPEAISGTLYSFGGGYISQNELVEGIGYWLRFPESVTLQITGFPITEVSITLIEDWNLITGISTVTGAGYIHDPDGIIISGTFYKYEIGYEQVNELIPGFGGIGLGRIVLAP